MYKRWGRLAWGITLGLMIAGLVAFVGWVCFVISVLSHQEEDFGDVEVSHVPVTIRVGFSGDVGVFDDEDGPSLADQYMEAHPWVTIVPVQTDSSAHHDQLFESLATGVGAPSVAMIDESYITEAVNDPDAFVNLLDLGAGQYEDLFLPWKWQEAANADGSVVIGLGYDVGGLALCYRADLFEAAGLPSNRDEVSAAVGDSWDDFIAFGEDYVAATGKKFIDNATNVLNPTLMQLGVGYYDRNNELDMDAVKSAWDTSIAVIEAGLSAFLWTDQGYVDWNDAMLKDGFAVVLCPSWMLDYIEQQVSADPSFTGQWDIADIPGPGGNWGGSFYTIPRQGTEYEQQEAYRFVEWLIQPERQVTIMKETGNLPSQITILESAEVDALTNPFFNDAPYGEIYAKTALDLPGPVYWGPNNGAVRVAVESILNYLQAGVECWDCWDATIAAAEAADV